MYAWIEVLCYLFIIIQTTSGQCFFNFETPLGSRTPIVLVNDQMIIPNNKSGVINLQNGQRIQFLCSGSNNYLIDKKIGKLAAATCLKNEFQLDSTGTIKYNFCNLKCKVPPQPEAKKIGTCNTHYTKIRIGFEIRPSKFLDLIELCFDEKRLTTYWSSHTLGYSSYSCQTSDGTSFKKDFFQNVPADKIYEQYSQFDRGHLTPKCDSSSGPTKRMTFYYVNAAPQISQFNRENWRDLEAAIRTAATQSQKYLSIYTGTTETVQLLNNTIPVPRYFWKAVIDRTNGEGVAFVGINNIQQNVPSPCKEVRCDLLSWLSKTFISRMSTIAKGKIYCCTIQTLQSIPSIQLPQFSDFKGGLLRSL